MIGLWWLQPGQRIDTKLTFIDQPWCVLSSMRLLATFDASFGAIVNQVRRRKPAPSFWSESRRAVGFGAPAEEFVDAVGGDLDRARDLRLELSIASCHEGSRSSRGLANFSTHTNIL